MREVHNFFQQNKQHLHQNALLFEDNNIDSLLSAYDKLDAVKSVIVVGGNATACEYNWQNIAERLSDIYRSLL